MDNNLKERKGFHSGQIQVLVKHKELFILLVAKYRVCMCCVYRTLMFVSSKIYTDRLFSQKVQEQILNQFSRNKECFQNQKLKSIFQEYMAILKNKQEQQFCWLCSGILQQPYLKQLADQIIFQIKNQDYGHKNKYKLNMRVHSMFSIKYQIFCNYLVQDLIQISSKEKAYEIYQEVIQPLFQKNALELKSVFKWVLAHIINGLPTQVFTLNSTIMEDDETHNSQQLDNLVGGLLAPYLHLTAVKAKNNRNKKIKIDITAQEFHVKWTVNMISKISAFQLKQWTQMATQDPKFVEKLMKMQLKSAQNIVNTFNLLSLNIYLCGKYVKYSRYISQTPWLAGNKKLAQSSLQEEIQNKIFKYFYPSTIPDEKIEIKFHAGGRQDIDVRMLKGGRPFVIEFVNPRFLIKDINMDELQKRVKTLSQKKFEELVNQSKENQIDEQSLKVKYLNAIINQGNDVAKVYELQKTTASYISIELKAAEGQKIKHYICFIKSEQPFSEKDKYQLQKYENLKIVQKTPVRVLHRRTLMYRDKMVHKMQFHQMTKFGAVLEIWASAGTYIKEFVHGDLNRTQPNVGSLLNKEVDILQLDVGSLREGEWTQGADKEMRIGKLPWEMNKQ